MPLEVGAPPEYLPERLTAHKRRLCHRMFRLHIRLFPAWPDLEDLDTLTNETKADIQLRPDMRSGSPLLYKSIDRFFNSLPLDIVQRHFLPHNARVQRRAAQRTVRCNPLLAARTPVVHSDGAVAERRRRDQLESSRAGQPALVQGRAVTDDPGVDEELVLVDQIQPVQLGRELAATEEHAGRGRVLELLHARAQVASDVVAVGPREARSRGRHHVLRLGLQLDRPLAHRRRRLPVAAGDHRPVALHHLVGDTAPEHRPSLVHEAGEESVCLVVGDSLLVVDATVEGNVDAEGQESHGDESTPSWADHWIVTCRRSTWQRLTTWR